MKARGAAKLAKSAAAMWESPLLMEGAAAVLLLAQAYCLATCIAVHCLCFVFACVLLCDWAGPSALALLSCDCSSLCCSCLLWAVGLSLLLPS